ncbi:MAG: hypothetical protein HY644_13420 [Acidobacteria bacterium]|nr:hypothetical protein [Acidobacteriota bacterium]
MNVDPTVRRKRESIVYLLAAILMFIRVDLWWWGKITPVVLFGWIDVAMLYQIGIWFVGWLLVVYTANKIWGDHE